MEIEPSEAQIAIAAAAGAILTPTAAVRVKEEPSSDSEEQMDESGRESCGGLRMEEDGEVGGRLREVKTEDTSAMSED